MSYTPDYKLAAERAIEVLEDSDITQAPIVLMRIIDRYSGDIKLVRYTSLASKYMKSVSDIVAMFDSDMGFCAYEPASNHYVIYINDTHSDAWIRFTIAHELGHIFLEHHKKAGASTMNRLFIPEEDYKEYEKEANVFARNLLSPAPLAKDVVTDSFNDLEKMYHLQLAFNITELASEMRLRYVYRDLRDYDESMLEIVNQIEVRYQKKCYECNTVVPRRAKYCISCGEKKLTRSLHYFTLPAAVEYDSNGRFVHCVRCGNSEHTSDAFFCRICGAPLRNSCIGDKNTEHVRHKNPSNALFCGSCGSTTVLNKYNIDINQEVSPMRYTDGVAYNHDTMQVLICPRCNNEEFGPNAKFCRICGMDLFNRCEGELVSSFGNEEYANQHPNPSNARFCEACGKPTSFYFANLLVDYDKYSVPDTFPDNFSFNQSEDDEKTSGKTKIDFDQIPF